MMTMFMKAVVGICMTAILTLGVTASAGAASSSAALKAKALSITNMPSGWSVDNSGSGGASGFSGCLGKLEAQQNARPKGLLRVRVSYTEGSTPGISETLVSGASAPAHYKAYVSVLNGCKQVGFEANGTQVTGSVGEMSFATVGDASKAYAFTFSAKGFNIGLDVVVFKVGNIAADIAYEDLGSPDASTVQAFATAAVDKIKGESVTTPTDAF